MLKCSRKRAAAVTASIANAVRAPPAKQDHDTAHHITGRAPPKPPRKADAHADTRDLKAPSDSGKRKRIRAPSVWDAVEERYREEGHWADLVELYLQRIDGASEWHAFRTVVFPALRPINIVIVVITTSMFGTRAISVIGAKSLTAS